MYGFWDTFGVICMATMMAPLLVAQEEPNDMGRRRRKNKQKHKQREQKLRQRSGNIKWSKRGRKKRYPKIAYATLFYTSGVKQDVLGTG